MPHRFLDISEDAFDDHYPLIANHLNLDASWSFLDTGGCLFETYGPELDFDLSQDPRFIWTLVDADEDDQYVISGFHLVNRIGYLISTVPVPEDVSIQVRLPMHGRHSNA